MPFDGGFLHKIKQELEPMIGARVDKIGQPNRDCVVIHLHNRGPVRRLVILAGAAPRLHFSAIPIEYPAAPPMFCLLLRKHLGGGRLTGVSQQGWTVSSPCTLRRPMNWATGPNSGWCAS